MVEIKKSTMMWIIIGVLLIATIFVTVKASSIGTKGATGNAIDTTGWTENEVMNYEMHGTIPARATGGSSTSPASSGMVGGC